VASLNELIGQVQQAIDQIEQAIGTAQAAEDSAGQLQSMYAGMDDEHKAGMMAGVKDAVEAWRGSLQGAIGQGRQLVQQVEGVKGGG
jgi:conjugal transfer/entry exclusion protein